jgi:hypothetical protein
MSLSYIDVDYSQISSNMIIPNDTPVLLCRNFMNNCATAIKIKYWVDMGTTLITISDCDLCFKFEFEFEKFCEFEVSLLINNIKFLSDEKQIEEASKTTPFMTNFYDNDVQLCIDTKVPCIITWYELHLPLHNIIDFKSESFNIYYENVMTLHYKNNRVILGG